MTAGGEPVRQGGRLATPRWRAVLTNLGLLAAALVVALVLAEVLVRLLAPQQLILKRPDIWQPDDTLGWVHQRNANTTVNTGERTVRFRTDREGFRVGARGRVESPTKILLLGDSFWEALQVEYEESLGGLLEARLPAALGAPVAVRNTAVGGWDPDQFLLQLKRALARDSFTLVVTSLYLDNDIIPYRRDPVPARPPVQVHRLRFPPRLSWSEVVRAILYPVNDFLEVRSHLFVLARSRFQHLRVRLGLSASYFPDPLLRSFVGAKAWANTIAICSDIAAVARSHDTPVIFVLLPHEIQVDSAKLSRDLSRFRIDSAKVDVDQPNRVMLGALKSQGINVVDATPALRVARRTGTKLYGDVDPHFTKAGHAIVADLLVPVLVARLQEVLPPRSGRATGRSARR